MTVPMSVPMTEFLSEVVVMRGDNGIFGPEVPRRQAFPRAGVVSGAGGDHLGHLSRLWNPRASASYPQACSQGDNYTRVIAGYPQLVE